MLLKKMIILAFLAVSGSTVLAGSEDTQGGGSIMSQPKAGDVA